MLLITGFLISIFSVLFVQAQTNCNPRSYGSDRIVCVCTSNHCDTIPKVVPTTNGQFSQITTNKAGLRFQKNTGLFGEASNSVNQILIDNSQEYQTINGWGGAFTDSFGYNLRSLPEQAQNHLLNSYFSENGLEYNLCRVPIGGTDFSLRGYTYNDGPEDKDLINFNLTSEDFNYKVPYILQAKTLTNNKLELLAGAWTAPKWMKTNNEYNGFGFLKDEMYQSWANYFIKFLDEYEKLGIQFWGISTGNEPSLAFTFNISHINTVGWLPWSMKNWIKDYLGPTVRQSTHSELKLLMLDDQRSMIPFFVPTVLGDETANGYIDGIATHWYHNYLIPASILTDIHNSYPTKFLIQTEACYGSDIFDEEVVIGSWDRGEAYSKDIIENLVNWGTGWLDWNMALDLTGGPTYIGNFVDSPILVNASSGEFYKQPMYYHLGHFAKFIPKNSVRIGSVADFNNKVTTVAFRRPDNGVVVVILNRDDSDISATVHDNTRGPINIELTQRSVTTILYW